jgi:hypothetical protein
MRGRGQLNALSCLDGALLARGNGTIFMSDAQDAVMSSAC